MDIYINNEKISFELENEKNSFEIISAVNEYIGNSHPRNFIINLEINDKTYSFSDEKSLKGIKIKDINKINIETNNVYEITNMSLKQIEDFIKLMHTIFSHKKWNNDLHNINDTINWMKEGIKQIVLIFGVNDALLQKEKDAFFDNCDTLIKIVVNLNPNNFSNDEEILNNALSSINQMNINILKIKNFLISSYKLPDKDYILNDINDLINTFEDIIPKLQNVPLLFQTGEDQESMNIIQRLADILERCINFFVIFKENFKLYMDKYIIKEVSFEEFFKTITNNLKELMEAIQNNDSVIISDLLEYEFIPNIEEIKAILIKIKEEAFTKAN